MQLLQWTYSNETCSFACRHHRLWYVAKVTPRETMHQTQNGRPVPNPTLAFTSHHTTGPGWGRRALQGIKREMCSPPSTSVTSRLYEAFHVPLQHVDLITAHNALKKQNRYISDTSFVFLDCICLIKVHRVRSNPLIQFALQLKHFKVSLPFMSHTWQAQKKSTFYQPLSFPAKNILEQKNGWK